MKGVLNGLWPLELAFLAIVAAAWFARGRAAAELRARLFEAMSAAVRRGVPLAPLVEHAAAERGRRTGASLRRLAEDLESGTSLAGALAHCRALRVPAPALAAIDASDGGPGLAGVLAAAARDTTTHLAVRHRAWGAAAYPLVVIAGLSWSASVSFPRLGEVFDSMDLVPPFSAWQVGLPTFSAEVLSLVLGVACSVVLLRGLAAPFRSRGPVRAPRRGVLESIPPFRGPAKLAGSARFLDALAALVRAGEPLADAVRTAAPASGHRAVHLGALALADAVESGKSATVAWDRVPLAPSLRSRAVAACSRAPSEAASALERLAVECRARRDACAEARLRWAAPAGVLVAGTFVALTLHGLFSMLDRIREAVPRW